MSGIIGTATKLDASMVTGVKLMLGGAQIGTSKDLTSGGASFNLGSDKFVIAQGTTKVVTMVGHH